MGYKNMSKENPVYHKPLVMIDPIQNIIIIISATGIVTTLLRVLVLVNPRAPA